MESMFRKIAIRLWYSQEELPQKFTLSELKNSGFRPSELKDLGYFAKQMTEVGFVLSDFVDREQGCLIDGSDRINDKFSVEELLSAGFKIPDIRHSGYPLDRFLSLDPKILKQNGFSLGDLIELGYNPIELRQVGFTQRDYRIAGLGKLYHPGTLFPVQSTHRNYSRSEWSCCDGLLDDLGCQLVSNNLTNTDLGSLVKSHNAGQLRDLGFSPIDARDIGMNAVELKKLGFNLKELLEEGGFLPWQLRDAGFTKFDFQFHLSEETPRWGARVGALEEEAGFGDEDLFQQKIVISSTGLRGDKSKGRRGGGQRRRDYDDLHADGRDRWNRDLFNAILHK